MSVSRVEEYSQYTTKDVYKRQITNGALWLQLSKSEGVNAKQKCHPRCETEMSCFGSENAFDRLAIYFRAFSFPNRNHENDNFLVYNLVYKAIA